MNIDLARKLRKTSTAQELKLWQHLRNQRILYLEGLGFNVLRFWNHEVVSQFDDVLEQIFRCIT